MSYNAMPREQWFVSHHWDWGTSSFFWFLTAFIFSNGVEKRCRVAKGAMVGIPRIARQPTCSVVAMT